MNNNESQFDIMKELVKSQQAYIRQLEQKVSLRDAEDAETKRMMIVTGKWLLRYRKLKASMKAA